MRWRERTSNAIHAMFEEYVEKLKRDLKVTSRNQFEERLHRPGTSLAGLRRVPASTASGRRVHPPCGRGSRIANRRPAIAGLLRVAPSSLRMPAKVSWQMLEFEFEHGPGYQAANDPTTQTKCETNTTQTSGASIATADGPGRKEVDFDFARYIEKRPSPLFSHAEARHLCEAALGELHRGIPFEQVVKHFTTGAKSDDGGWQPRLKPESVADPKTAEASAICRKGRRAARSKPSTPAVSSKWRAGCRPPGDRSRKLSR